MLVFEKQYIKDPKTFTDQNIHHQISPGTFIYMENFNITTDAGWKFTIEKFENRELVYKLNADRIEWDSVKLCWRLSKYFRRTINGKTESLSSGATMDTVLPLKPDDFTEDIEEVKTMNYFVLEKHIKRKEMRGDPDVIKYKVKKYERIASPFATIILTVIGVSVSSRKVRGGIGFHLGLGLALTFVYILFMQIFTVFATFGDLPALPAVWIPNIIFGFIAFFLYKIAPK
jgi:lipopolysaccharide export system permease protein